MIHPQFIREDDEYIDVYELHHRPELGERPFVIECNGAPLAAFEGHAQAVVYLRVHNHPFRDRSIPA